MRKKQRQRKPCQVMEVDMKYFFNFDVVRCEKCGRFYYGRETLICVRNKGRYYFF